MPSEAQVLEQNNQNFKITKTNILKEIKEGTINVKKKQDIIKRNKVVILVIPSKIVEIKSTLDGIKSKMDMAEKGISESKRQN